MPRRKYKALLEQSLQKRNWLLISIDESDHWWDDEHWQMQSKLSPDLTFYVCFLVDPMYDGPTGKGQGVNVVKAVRQFPDDWNDDSSLIASIELNRADFHSRLKTFVTGLDRYIAQSTSSGLPI